MIDQKWVARHPRNKWTRSLILIGTSVSNCKWNINFKLIKIQIKILILLGGIVIGDFYILCSFYIILILYIAFQIWKGTKFSFNQNFFLDTFPVSPHSLSSDLCLLLHKRAPSWHTLYLTKQSIKSSLDPVCSPGFWSVTLTSTSDF